MLCAMFIFFGVLLLDLQPVSVPLSVPFTSVSTASLNLVLLGSENRPVLLDICDCSYRFFYSSQ